MTLAVIVEGVRTRKDRTLAVTLGTQEVSPSQAGQLVEMTGKLCAVYLTEKESIPQEVIDAVDEADFDRPGKTQSQRIRGVLYKLFEQDAEGFKTFDEYYHNKTEKYIEHLKLKIK
jgi:hypothetical protein